MKRVVSAIVLIALLVGIFFLREILPWTFPLFLAIISCYAVYEITTAFGDRLSLAQKILLMLIMAGACVMIYFMGTSLHMLGVYFLCCSLVLLSLPVFDQKISFEGIASSMLIVFYPIFPLSLFGLFHNYGENGLLFITLSICVAFIPDTFAYFFGRAIGGPKLCPAVSPKKTVAGAIGALLGGVAAAFAAYYFMLLIGTLHVSISWYWLVLGGFIGGALAVLGDLAESNIKRKIGLKDFGNLLPGHGGIMDRLDSVVFTTVFTYIFYVIILGIV